MANNQSYVFLNNVKPRRDNWRVHVKLLHSWTQNTSFGRESLECVLADETGVKIHASCKKNQMYRLQRNLPIGEWRFIQNFHVSDSRGKYRPTPLPYKLTFNSETQITRSVFEDDNPYLTLASYENIGKVKSAEKFLIDIIGEVIDLGQIQTVQVHQEDRKRLHFRLRDTSGHDLPCCLWGKYAEQFESTIEDRTNETLICLIRFAKISFYKGDLQITNAFDASVVTLNPTMKEAIEFKEKAEIVLAALNSSYLWEHCKVFKLTKNMRLLSGDLTPEEAHELKEFSEWILKVGEGKIAEPNDGEAEIDIPEEFLITNSDDPIEAISQAVYGDNATLQENKDPKFFQERAILCPTNEDVNMINQYMLDKLDGEEKIYISADSIDPIDKISLSDEALGPDFLNTIKVSGLPNHSLRLKVGCPVMVLRNIAPTKGLMNGTRLQITQLMDFMVEARIITGENVGDIVYIPRLLITPSDTRLPFKMRRRQLPLAVAFAITINKNQGQSLSEVGLFLPRPVFSHGQLYVAISRVTSKKGLKILILYKDGKPQKKTMNVVFKEIFNNLEEKE